MGLDAISFSNKEEFEEITDLIGKINKELKSLYLSFIYSKMGDEGVRLLSEKLANF